jgi:ELWxxDGT repeat protein
MFRFVAWCAISVCAAAALAQAPYLVKDIPTNPTAPQSSNPAAFFASGGKVFFTAAIEHTGAELWVSDAGGTRLVRDIRSGSTSSGIPWFAELTPGTVVFSANDGVRGPELWRSDGTEAGTVLVKELNTITGAASVYVPGVAVNGKAFFAVNDGVHGFEPWVTDGTEAGTQLLSDVIAGTVSSNPFNFFSLNGKVFFFAGGQMLASDGTPGGTSVVRVLSASTVTVTGNVAFLIANDGTTGTELWKTDGTDAGTSLIKDIRPGDLGSYVQRAIAATPTGIVFFANDGTATRLWKSDGTAANTVPVEEFGPLLQNEQVPVLTSTPAGVFWVRQQPVAGNVPDQTLWFTDGTAANTRLVFDVGSATFPVSAFSKLYFVHGTTGGYRIWTSDGTTAGTVQVSTASLGSSPNLTSTGGKLYFAGLDARGTEPWVIDDAAGISTHILADAASETARSSYPQDLRAAGPHVYFNLELPSELWRSDGTAGGTFEATDLNSNLLSPPPFAYTSLYQGNIYFKHAHSALYRFSASANTAVVPQLFGDHSIDVLHADERYLYMWGWSFGGRLKRTDGTAEGTIVLHDPSDPTEPTDNLMTTFDRGRVWVHDADALYRTEGTIETTRRVVTLPSTQSFYGNAIVPMGGALYAVVTHWGSSPPHRLWRSDGTAEGAAFLTPLTQITQLTAVEGLLFFASSDAEHGTELWRSDGTEAGTFRVKDVAPGTASSAPAIAGAVNGTLYFTANDGLHGVELWKSDGTEAGTMLVDDIGPGTFSSNPQNFAVADGKLWFAANDGLRGTELWSTDGTPEGTVLAADIAPGSAASEPKELTPADGALFFSAVTLDAGRELWAVPLSASAFTIGDARIAEGHAGTTVMRFTVERRGPLTSPASVAFTTGNGTATAGSDYDAATGTLAFAAGERARTLDVVVRGDAELEPNETFFVRLSSPAGGVLERGYGGAMIENDDARADLAIEQLPSATSDTNYDTPNQYRITNHGPSSATKVAIRLSESPFNHFISAGSVGSTYCENAYANPARCTLTTLAAGETRTITVYKNVVGGVADPALPPGRTVTASITSEVSDPDPSNNSAASMRTGNGMLALAPFLTTNTQATVSFLLPSTSPGAVDVTLTATNGVTVTPPTAHIEPGQLTATFTLGVPNAAGSTLLRATTTNGFSPALVVPIVAPGSIARLDVAIAATHETSYPWGTPVSIVTNVAARRHDGTLPTGVVSLLDASNNVLSQSSLDGTATATLTRENLNPGQYQYRIRYDGDANFQPLTIPLQTITVQSVETEVSVKAPKISCSATFDVTVTVYARAGTLPPAGTVAIYNFQAFKTRLTLAPSGVPGQSVATGQVTMPAGPQISLVARYEPTGSFLPDDGFQTVAVGCANMNLTATATSPTSVALSWSAVPGTSGYFVHRGTTRSNVTQRMFVSGANTTTYVDDAVPNSAYVYYVLPAISGSTYSEPDFATTFAWTDSPLTTGVKMKAAHLLELRSAVSAMRTLADLPPVTFYGAIAPGTTVHAQHVSELRGMISFTREVLGVRPYAFTHTGPAIGSIISAAPIQELRNALQ